jgi:hypothetical protein
MQYPVIAQPQYGFAPTMPMMPSMSDMPTMPMMPTMNFKKGGIASLSLPEMADMVESAGRNGDTMLAHITPEEAGILQLLGGSGTINPMTGQPEYFKKFIKKIVPKEIYKPISSLGKGIERGVESVAKALGPVGQIAAAYFGGPIGAALYAGLAPEGSSFDVKRAAIAGALTYGAQQYAQGAGGDAAGGDVSTLGGEAAPIDVAATQTAAEAAASAPSVSQAIPSPGSFADVGEYYSGAGASVPGAVPPAPAPFIDRAIDYAQNIPTKISEGIQSLPQTVAELPGKALDFAADLPGKALDYAIENPATTALVGTQVAAGVQAKKELDAQKAEAERILAEQEKYTREEVAFAKDVLRRYPVEYRRLSGEDVAAMNMAGGGLASLNAFKAGGRPRFLKGGGDGMSDDIPATIGGRQKAALSDGEFVIPADVVSHLGNGSSRAGAKKLYSMMDNIRKARTGKERQAPEVKADRYMPA